MPIIKFWQYWADCISRAVYSLIFCADYISRTQNINMHGTKIKFPIKDFFSKCDQIRRKLRFWSQLLKKSLVENFTISAVMENLKAHFITSLAFLIKNTYMLYCFALFYFEKNTMRNHYHCCLICAIHF